MSGKSSYGQGQSALLVWISLVIYLLILSGCEDEPGQREYPRIRTLEVTNITGDGATFVAEVTHEGTVPITEHGFAWSIFLPDVRSAERINLGSFSGKGRYEAEIRTALDEGIAYEVCAFVKAGDYTVYGDEVQFMSLGSGAPEVLDFQPYEAAWGDTVTITGMRFSYVNSTNRISVDDLTFLPFYSSDTLLKFVLSPEVIRTENSLSVSIFGNVATATHKLLLIIPELYGFTPSEVHWGDTVTFTGHHLNYLGRLSSDGMVLSESVISKVATREEESVSFLVPGHLSTTPATVSVVYGPFIYSFPQSITLLPPVIDSIAPGEATWGSEVTLYGKFNSQQERSRVMFGDMEAQIISHSRELLIVKVPANLAEYVTTVKYTSEPFTCEYDGSFSLKRPEISEIEPLEGYVGQIITIRGKYFRKNITTVEIGGKEVLVRSANDTVITCYVPGDIYGECEVTVSLNGYTVSAGEAFNATNHVITEVTPLIVAYGETVTVRGANFRPGTLLYLGQYEITPAVLTEGVIQFAMPPWLPYQPWSLSVKYSYWNSDQVDWAESSCTYPDQFQLKDFNITGVTPVTGEAGDIVTITGTDFGSPDVTFGSVGAELIESTSSLIRVKVPPLSSGEHTINVTIGGRTHACPAKYTHSGPWHRLADLPFLFDYGCSFDFGEEAYALTGGESGAYVKEIYRFDNSSKEFTRIPGTFYSEILNPISCTLAGKGYMIGQKGTSIGIGFEVFNPDNMTVSRLADYPGTFFVNPCIIADDSVIYAGCGKAASSNFYQWYKDFWKYSPATNKWTRLADCPYNVSFSNHVYIDGRLIFLANLYVMGGVRYLLEYKPLTNTWDETELSEDELGYWLLWDFKNGAKVSVINEDKWYIGFGDWYQNNENYGTTNPDINNRFYIFDPADDTWETITNVVAPPRTFALHFSIGGKIYIGGHQIYQWYDFWEYDPQLDQ